MEHWNASGGGYVAEGEQHEQVEGLLEDGPLDQVDPFSSSFMVESSDGSLVADEFNLDLSASGSGLGQPPVSSSPLGSEAILPMSVGGSSKGARSRTASRVFWCSTGRPDLFYSHHRTSKIPSLIPMFDYQDQSAKNVILEKEHMFDKVVTDRDINRRIMDRLVMDRLVIPREDAEKYLPLVARENTAGLVLSFEDRPGKLWRFHCSYSDHNQSYVLSEGWRSFAMNKGLKIGDTISFYRGATEATRGLLFIDWECSSRCLNSPPAGQGSDRAMDPSSPSSSVTPIFLNELVQRLVQIRTMVSSLGEGGHPDASLAAANELASDAKECLQDLHYESLLPVIGRTQNNTSRSTSIRCSRFADEAYAKIRNTIIPALDEWMQQFQSQRVQPSASVFENYVRYMEAINSLVTRCIVLFRGILGIRSILCSESDNMEENQRRLPVPAFDDLNYSAAHGKITRIDEQTLPSCCRADPIYLLPAAIRNLLYLDLSNCSHLVQLPPLESLHNLSALNLSSCHSLGELRYSLGGLKNLQILVLSFCHKLHLLPVQQPGDLFKLRVLDLSGCSSLQILPDSFDYLFNLENLNLSDCVRLKYIPQYFGKLPKLRYLNFSGCQSVNLNVDCLRKLVNLECLTLSDHTTLQDFPYSFKDLANRIDLSRWWKYNWVHPQCNLKATLLQSYRCHQQSIIKRLLSDGSDEGNITSEQSITSICIVGESGIGKTELLHEIYNDEMILEGFHLRIWINMRDKKRLLEKIIEFTTRAYFYDAPSSILEETVREELNGKRFLLVLDDADIENQFFWSDVRKLANVGAVGSALIVTTRSKEVATLSGAMQTYYLSSLSREECFMVFQEHVIGGFDINNFPQLTNFVSKIVEKCGGNPLCMKALSGLLCHSETALSEIDSLVGGILPALRLCYDLLPSRLKQCFKYCSLFPKDNVFVRHHIVQLWISQGFIYPEEDSQPEDTGLKYFDELFCRSFFKHCPFSNNDHEDKFVVHELFHDLACSVSKDECFSSEEPFCSLTENICHLSLVLSDSNNVVLSKELRHLQSLMVVRRSPSEYSSLFVPRSKILGLNDLLMRSGFLRVLNLSCTTIVDLPSFIGKMKHLRFLALNNTKIKSLPADIGQLDTLQTLELKDCCCLIELPESTNNLMKLRHLDVRKEPGNVHVGMPFGLGKLTDLQTLTVFNIGGDSSHCSIGDLKNFSGLRGHVHITGLQNIAAGNDAKEANIVGMQFLEALTLEWCCNSEDIEDDCDKEIANQVLQNLQPNTSLQELAIQNYPGNLFPVWIQDSSFCMLVSITIDDCQDCNEIPYLGDLPSLKYLFIQKMCTVESFGQRCNSLTTERKHAPRFPSLEILNLWEMYSLKFWNGTNKGDFPRLCRLSISRCPKLSNLPPLISLVYLSFHCGEQLPALSELPSLKSMKIEGFQKLKSVRFCPEMPMLQKLEISDCKELVSIDVPLLSVSNSKVVRCPKLHFGGSSLEGCLMWERLQRDKCTMKSLLVKTMPDDGWNWRKCSQKDILGSKYQRSYFRCNQMHSAGCKARKIVEPNNDDLNIWLVTYIYEHSHQQGPGPCDEPSPSDLHLQLATTRKRKKFDASNDEITSKKQFSEE